MKIQFLVEGGVYFLVLAMKLMNSNCTNYVETSGQLLVEITFQDTFKESLKVGFSSYRQLKEVK